LAEVKKNTLVWTVDPATLPATLPGKTPGPKKRKNLGGESRGPLETLSAAGLMKCRENGDRHHK
jgi:hypothetical protein